MYPIELRDLLQPVTLAAVRHQGPYLQVGQAFEQLGQLCALLQPAPDARWFGLFHDNPQLVPSEQLRVDACVELAAQAPLVPGVQRAQIAAGRYAVVHHHGPYAELESLYLWLYQTWLPQSGMQRAPGPSAELYLNSPQNTAPADLHTEIWLPLQAL